MDVHTRQHFRYQQDEEPFYYSPAHRPEDIIWEGSDEEEDDVETESKRLRYEEQARRYAHGQMPIIISASLKGPFERDSGWANPWRGRFQKKADSVLEECDEIPGNRTNDTTQSTDHLSYGTTSTPGGDWERTNIAGTVGGFATEDTHDQPYVEQSGRTVDQEEAENEPRIQSWRSFISSGHMRRQPYLPSEGRSRSDVSIVRDFHHGTRAAKRSIDSQWWLKGSYVSKRAAQWNGPAETTPTPNPTLLVQKVQRLNYESTNPSRLGRVQPLSTSNPLGTIQQAAQDRGQYREFKQDAQNMPPQKSSFSQQGDIQSTRNTPKYPHQNLEDTLYEEKHSQTVDSSYYGQPYSRPRFIWSGISGSDDGIAHDTNSGLQPEGLSVNSPSSMEQSWKTPPSKHLENHIQSSNPFPDAPPKLPSNSNRSLRPGQRSRSEGEISFVTEVASSSRDLEQFQYRKRRVKNRLSKLTSTGLDHDYKPTPVTKPARMNTQEEDLLRSGPYGQWYESKTIDESPASSMNTSLVSDPSTCLHKPTPKQQTTEANTQDEEVLISGPYLEWYRYEEPGLLSAEGSISRSPSESRGSNGGRNAAEMLLGEQLSSPRSVLEHVQQPGRSRESSCIDEGSEISISEHGEDVPENHQLPSSLSNSTVLLASQELPKPLKESATLSTIGSFKVKTVPNAHDLSTQSYNTTPSRSAMIRERLNEIAEVTEVRSALQGKNSNVVIRKVINRTSQKSPSTFDASLHLTVEPQSTNHRIVESSKLKHNAVRKEGIERNSHKSLVEPIENRNDTDDADDADDDVVIVPSLQTTMSEESRGGPEISDHIAPTPKALRTPKPASQVVKPGDQSPWVETNFQPLPAQISPNHSITNAAIDHDEIRDQSLKDNDSPQTNTTTDDVEWQPEDRFFTPENDTIRPLLDIIKTPPSAIESDNEKQLSSAQSLFDATTDNPWKIPKRKSNTKPSKRVSFKDLPESERRVRPKNVARRPFSPPPQTSFESSQDESLDDSATSNTFGKHFSAVKQPQRLIPDNLSISGSPSVGAMAEAFIAADLETSILQQGQPTRRSDSRYLQPSSEAMTNLPRPNKRKQEPSFIVDGASNQMAMEDELRIANFDMEAVLGQVGELFKDWSVDAELEKARDINMGREIESNSAKRRKLFGIIRQ